MLEKVSERHKIVIDDLHAQEKKTTELIFSGN